MQSDRQISGHSIPDKTDSLVVDYSSRTWSAMDVWPCLLWRGGGSDEILLPERRATLNILALMVVTGEPKRNLNNGLA